jgi:hypothetical protein
VTHCSDEDLILHYYAEPGEGLTVVDHLNECARCAAAYRDLAGALNTIPVADVPERGPQYGLEVWQRIRHQLPDPDGSWHTIWFGWNQSVFAGIALTLLVAGFLVGRAWPRTDRGSSPGSVESSSTIAGEPQRRVLLTVVADHLDRSGRMLTDIMNAPEGADISMEQEWADDLLTTSRLYRQDAIDVGERSVAAVLDDVERALIEIVHSPARATSADLEQMRQRIDAASLLFKVRVLSDELQQRGRPPAASGPRRRLESASSISKTS